MITTRMTRLIVGTLALSVSAALVTAPATASAATSASVPSAASAPTLQKPRPDLAGVRVKSPNNPAIYLIDPKGYRRWIPKPDTYNALFRNWNGVVVDLGTNEIPERPALDDTAFLAKAPDSPEVYLVSNGRKRWIVSPAAFDKYWFAWDKIVVVPNAALNAIPTGPIWT